MRFASAAIIAVVLAGCGGSSSPPPGETEGMPSGPRALASSRAIGKKQAESFLARFASRVRCEGRQGPNEVCEAFYSGSKVKVTLGVVDGRRLLTGCRIVRMGTLPASKYACQHLESEIGLSQSGPGTSLPKG